MSFKMKIAGMIVASSLLMPGLALALNVIPSYGDLSKFGSFADDKTGKKTQISFEKSVDAKKGEVLKIRYNLDKDSWCGVYRTSLDQNWLGAKMLNVTAQGTKDSVIRVSFLDKNKVSYVADMKISDEWSVAELPIADFKKNPYYQPPDAHPDKPMDLKRVAQIQFEPQTPGNGMVSIATIEELGSDDSLNNDNGVGEKSTKGQEMFETFEGKKQANVYKYQNDKGGATMVAMIQKRENPKNPNNKYLLQTIFDSGKGDYGCGFGFNSGLVPAATPPAPAASVNVKGRTILQIMAKATKGIQFRVSVVEADENDGEKWTSPTQMGTGSWDKYSIPMRSMTKNYYAGNQEGNGVLNLEDVKSVEFEILQNQGKGELDVDDVLFR